MDLHASNQFIPSQTLHASSHAAAADDEQT